MAFDSLSEKLQNVFKNLRSKGRLTEDDVKTALKEVKMALLEADVNFRVVKKFVKDVQERAIGQDVMSGLNPGQMVIKIVNEEMVKLMGSETTEIAFRPGKELTVIMMVGLQGAGKTTTTAKIAGKLKTKGKKTLLAACDVYRPAAIEQLQINGEKQGVEVFAMGNKNKPADETELWKTWEVCSPQNVEKFSALAYLFGKELYDRLRVPIGLVQSAYGGASAEAWMGLETLKTFPEMKDELEKYGKYNFVNDTIQKYAKRAEQQIPTLLYNTMLYPLHVLPVKGVIWYQGCTNVGSSFYTRLMNSLIKSWRNLWGYNFPFYYVQLAGFLKQETVQPESNWAALRWSQWKTLELPRTGMATAVDIGNEKDIHPKNKQEVARRLALLALNKTYGKKDLVCEAPAPVKYSFSEGKATLTFNNKIHVRNDSVACGFILCDANNKFVEGKAKLENPTTISITGAGLGKITAVRYDWADYPIGNIYGDTNLPVLPFRTDEMPLVNIEKK